MSYQKEMESDWNTPDFQQNKRWYELDEKRRFRRASRMTGRHNFILAFPGMGKTVLAKRTASYADADFGIYRTLRGISKADEDILLYPFSLFCRSLGNINILLNEPKLCEYLPINVMYLPKKFSYSAKKMKVSEEQIKSWVQGWADLAKQHNIPVVYISVGLDHYLRKD